MTFSGFTNIDNTISKYIYQTFGQYYDACSSGHMDIVNRIIEKEEDDWNAGLIYACFGGHMDVVVLMIEKGADDWNGGVTWCLF